MPLPAAGYWPPGYWPPGCCPYWPCWPHPGSPAGGGGGGGVVGAGRGVGRAVVRGRLVDGRVRPAKGLTRRLVPRVAWARPLGHGDPPVVSLSSPGWASRSTPTRTGGAGTP